MSLKKIGGMHAQMLVYLKSFIRKEEHLLIDITNVPSNSGQISLSRMGYSNSHNFNPQFTLLYIYSAHSHMPVYYRLLPGNIREAKALKTACSKRA